MRTLSVAVRLVPWLLAVLLLTACARGQAPVPVSAPATFTDPFQYCKAVGTIDAPDARYTGPQVPLAVAEGLRKAFGLPDSAPLEPFQRGTSWRCMEGKLFACTVGANLPCQEKADVSRTPSQGMADFCKVNPGADVIPAYVTGRATVYLWRCSQGAPEVVRQVTQPDSRGFLANVWHEIST
jgi:hypothetical protein